MEGNPQWAETVLDQLEWFIELESPGSLDIRFSDVECTLIIAPEVVELVGGEEDGEEVFSYYTVQITELTQLFDDVPHLSWHTMYDELWVEGTIGGERAFLIFQKYPFSDSEVSQVFDGGSLREKRPPT